MIIKYFNKIIFTFVFLEFAVCAIINEYISSLTNFIDVICIKIGKLA